MKSTEVTHSSLVPSGTTGSSTLPPPTVNRIGIAWPRMLTRLPITAPPSPVIPVAVDDHGESATTWLVVPIPSCQTESTVV